MVCIAAFIILCFLSLFVAILSIFKRELGKKYWKIFKKSWGCVGKKVTLQKCETNFKDDVKNSILSKVVLRRPKLVKPLNIVIEVASVLIVAITVWSLAVALKSGLALWVFGTCDVTKPSSCSLGADACSIDQAGANNPVEAFGLWFTEWGEIFTAIPDKLKIWDPIEYGASELAIYGGNTQEDRPFALDVLDPGCIACMQSFKNQVSSGFMDSHKVALLLYPIQNPEGGYLFKNSGLIVRYLLSIDSLNEKYAYSFNSWTILEKIFTGYDDNFINYQSIFNEQLSEEASEDLLLSWLKELGLSRAELEVLATFAHSDEITDKMVKNAQIVEKQVRAKGIPTTIYDGKKHTGLFSVN